MDRELPHGGSFDPRTWVGPEAGGTGVSPSPRVRHAPVPDDAGGGRRWAIAAVTALAILLIGAGIAWSQQSVQPAGASARTMPVDTAR